MTWLEDGSLQCDNCQALLKAYGSPPEHMLDLARTSRWGIFFGVTEGGLPCSIIHCRWCRENTHKRVIKPAQTFEDTPLWENQ
jgi:hypothetical protein